MKLSTMVYFSSVVAAGVICDTMGYGLGTWQRWVISGIVIVSHLSGWAGR